MDKPKLEMGVMLAEFPLEEVAQHLDRLQTISCSDCKSEQLLAKKMSWPSVLLICHGCQKVIGSVLVVQVFGHAPEDTIYLREMANGIEQRTGVRPGEVLAREMQRAMEQMAKELRGENEDVPTVEGATQPPGKA